MLKWILTIRLFRDSYPRSLLGLSMGLYLVCMQGKVRSPDNLKNFTNKIKRIQWKNKRDYQDNYLAVIIHQVKEAVYFSFSWIFRGTSICTPEKCPIMNTINPGFVFFSTYGTFISFHIFPGRMENPVHVRADVRWRGNLVYGFPLNYLLMPI